MITGKIELSNSRWKAASIDGYFGLNVYANSTQNSNYRFIVTGRRKSGRADRKVSPRNPTRAFSHEKLARNAHS